MLVTTENITSTSDFTAVHQMLAQPYQSLVLPYGASTVADPQFKSEGHDIQPPVPNDGRPSETPDASFPIAHLPQNLHSPASEVDIDDRSSTAFSETALSPNANTARPRRPVVRLPAEVLKELQKQWASDPTIPSLDYRRDFAQKYGVKHGTVYNWFYKRSCKALGVTKLSDLPSEHAHQLPRSSLSPPKEHLSLESKATAMLEDDYEVKYSDTQDFAMLGGNADSALSCNPDNALNRRHESLDPLSQTSVHSAVYNHSSPFQPTPTPTPQPRGFWKGYPRDPSLLPEDIHDGGFRTRSHLSKAVAVATPVSLHRTPPQAHSLKPSGSEKALGSTHLIPSDLKRNLEERVEASAYIHQRKGIRVPEYDLDEPDLRDSPRPTIPIRRCFCLPHPDNDTDALKPDLQPLLDQSPLKSTDTTPLQYAELAEIKFEPYATNDFNEVNSSSGVLDENGENVSSTVQSSWQFNEDAIKGIYDNLSKINSELGL